MASGSDKNANDAGLLFLALTVLLFHSSPAPAPGAVTAQGEPAEESTESVLRQKLRFKVSPPSLLL